jgi:quinol monooxygenase YgiN
MPPKATDQPVDALLPGRLGLVVRLESKSGMRLPLLDCLNRYADQLNQEPATEGFVVSLDPDDQNIIWLFEWFLGEEGLNDHRTKPAFAKLMEEMPPLLASPPGILRVDPLRMHLQRNLINESLSEGNL